MAWRIWRGAALAAFAGVASAAAQSTTTAAPPSELAPGVQLLAGAHVPGSQPDGNTVVVAGPEGLIVFDTGRHAAHTARIVDLARASGRPVVAVVNSHWHLDHIGGNPALRRAFPGLEVHASGALRGALDGFLANYRRQLDQLVAAAKSPEEAAPYRAELAILDAAPSLAPDRLVSASGVRRLAGREVELHLETHAVTAGDVWLYDPATRTLLAGDLVTLPAPFLDTACPARWQAALGRLAAVDFALLVPGHGPPMDRSAFATYRSAFDALLACGATERPAADCVEVWLGAAGELVPAEQRQLGRALVDYYVDQVLRAAPEQRAGLCGD